MADENSQIFSIRFPNDLAEEGKKLAEVKKITFANLVKRSLKKAIDEENDTEAFAMSQKIQSFISKIRGYADIVVTEKMVKNLACETFLELKPCPHCSNLNLSGSMYCSWCGERIGQDHPDLPYAFAFFSKWYGINDKKNGDETEPRTHFFILLSPNAEIDKFVVMRMNIIMDVDGSKEARIEPAKVEKILTDEDIEEGKKIFPEYKDDFESRHTITEFNYSTIIEDFKEKNQSLLKAKEEISSEDNDA